MLGPPPCVGEPTRKSISSLGKHTHILLLRHVHHSGRTINIIRSFPPPAFPRTTIPSARHRPSTPNPGRPSLGGHGWTQCARAPRSENRPSRREKPGGAQLAKFASSRFPVVCARSSSSSAVDQRRARHRPCARVHICFLYTPTRVVCEFRVEIRRRRGRFGFYTKIHPPHFGFRISVVDFFFYLVFSSIFGFFYVIRCR